MTRKMELPPPDGEKALVGQVLQWGGQVLCSGSVESDMPETHACGDAE